MFKPNQGSAMYVPKTEEFSEYPLFGSLEMDVFTFFQTEATKKIQQNPRLVEFESTMKPKQLTIHPAASLCQGEEKLPEWDEWQATEPDDLPSLWQNEKENSVRYRKMLTKADVVVVVVVVD